MPHTAGPAPFYCSSSLSLCTSLRYFGLRAIRLNRPSRRMMRTPTAVCLLPARDVGRAPPATNSWCKAASRSRPTCPRCAADRRENALPSGGAFPRISPPPAGHFPIPRDSRVTTTTPKQARGALDSHGCLLASVSSSRRSPWTAPARSRRAACQLRSSEVSTLRKRRHLEHS